MVLFAVKIDVDSKVSEVINEFNERLCGAGQNPALVFFDGKATLIFDRGETFIFFNVRVNPFEPPLYKYLFFLMFKRSLKNKRYSLGKPKLLDNRGLSRLLEGCI
ncbi:MAG: hypothetical protein GY853_02225 [PVC group bacterium]|nr:hypothetical protein [PVC group bacterium]